MGPLWMNDYSYVLPEERIAKFPLERRDDAKLLVSRDGIITHAKFSQLSDFLNDRCTLFFNDTKVIPARLLFQKQTGASIEILLLSPEKPFLTQLAMSSVGECSWRCMIGNLKRWTESLELKIDIGLVELRAKLLDKDKGIVQFTWNPSHLTFAEIVQQIGDTPLPPYLQRNATELDRSRYQTVYANYEGAVAAPTAGLHFTSKVLQSLKAKGIQTDFLTLHVSAGTFLPVKSDNALEHHMHEERISINRTNVLNLLEGRTVVPVGTTSMRTLESLYWFGCILQANPSAEFDIKQETPYSTSLESLSLNQSLKNVMRRLQDSDRIEGKTSIFIRPGYTFRVCDALITNFHQPGSTLLLLVAALLGPRWRMIYDEALKRGYRFLSYGDSSLLFPSKT